MKWKLWVAVLALALLACCAPALADGPSGYCGEQVTWFIGNDTLTVRGNGEMNDYADPLGGAGAIAPWYQYRNDFHKIVIREGVTKVGSWAFAYTGVDRVDLPLTMDYLGPNSFASPSGLDVYYNGSEADYNRLFNDGAGTSLWTVYCRSGVVDDFMYWEVRNDGELYVRAGTLVPWDMPGFGFFNEQPWRGYTDEITHITISGPFRSIHNYAFTGLWHVAYVEIDCPDLQTVGWYAFDGCTALNTVYYVGSQAQWNALTVQDGNAPLTSADVRFTKGSCGNGLSWSLSGSTLRIYGNGNMTNYSTIGAPPWSSMGNLVERIIVEQGVLSIGLNAFATCANCVRVDLPASVNAVGKNAFLNMTRLEKAYYNDTAEQWSHVSVSVGNEFLSAHLVPLKGSCGTFAQWSVANDKLTITGSGAISDYTYDDQPWLGAAELFDTVVINGPDTVGAYAFYNIRTIHSVTLRNKVDTIRFNAFDGCVALTEVNQTEGLERVQSKAFQACVNLQYMYLPDDAFVAEDAFDGCPKYAFTVMFYLKGHGQSNGLPAQTVYRGRAVADPGTPTADGWVFTGWYSDYACTVPYNMNQGVSSNMNLYAGWRVDDCEVSFIPDGGAGEMATVRVLRGQTYTLPENGFTPPAGQAFYGWQVNQNTTRRLPGETITVNAPVTLRAMWYGPYTITFNRGSGSGAMAAAQVKPGSSFTMPNCGFTPPDGAVFTYWVRSGDNRAIWPGTGFTVDRDMTFTAQYKGPFYVSFQNNGATGVMGTRTVGYGENFMMPLCTLTPPAGKAFSYWRVTGAGFEADMAPGGILTMQRSLTLTPMWRAAEVTFKHNGGSGPLYNPCVTVTDADGCIELPECTLMPPDGMRFNGWGDALGQPGQRLEIHGDTTLNAMWTTSILTITFAKNGATGDTHMDTFIGTHYYTLPEPDWLTPPAGMAFCYWYIPQAVSNGKAFYPGETVQLITNATATPQWVVAPPSTCTVTFDPSDGSGSMPVITVGYGTYYTLPECAFTPPEGKIFEHWTMQHDGYYMGTYYPGDQAQIYYDMTMVPYFRDIVYQYIVFRDPENNEILANQAVPEGEMPEDPGYFSKPGYTQTGWMFRYIQDGDSDWTIIPYDFNQPLEYYRELSGEPSYVAVGVWAEFTENEYYLSLNVSEGGAAHLSTVKETYHYGDWLYVTWDADEGYYIDSVTLVPSVGEPVDVTYDPFGMPDCDAVIEVTFRRPVTHGGSFGEGLYWSLSESGNLTITGAGDMPNFSWENEAPWMTWKNDIHSVDIQPGITGVGTLAFAEMGGIYSVSLPDTVTRIGSMAFYCCNSLAEITLPDGLTILGDSAFQETALTTVDIPAGVRVIDESAFAGCVDLNSVTLHEGLEEIGPSAFDYCESLLEISIPQSVTEVGSYAFDNCIALRRVSGFEHLEQLPGGLFCECNSLTDVGLLPRVSVIEGDAFARCHSLGSIAIPSTVTRIEDWAFDECDSLTAVYYEGSRAMWDAIQIGNYNDGLQNATIYCKLTLTFETFGGPEIDPVLLDWNEIPARPDDPERVGAYFRGWYLEDTLDTLYDFSYPLNADATLYADYLGPDPRITLRLPDALTVIESEAFAGARVIFVAVPKTVVSIAADAFPDTVEYVLGYPGSVAEIWARVHGVAFISIDDAWMSIH